MCVCSKEDLGIKVCLCVCGMREKHELAMEDAVVVDVAL